MYWNRTGGENSALGRTVLMNNISGYQNTAVGNRSMENNGSGYGNTAIGYWSLLFNIYGNLNTAVGDSANVASISLNNATAIGAKAMVSRSNSMSFGDVNVSKWAFAKDSATSGVFQVGYNNTNGNGAYLTAGGVWTDISDERMKDSFQPLEPAGILEKIMQLPVTRWKYRGTENEYHIGPMAQRFQQLFMIGDGRSLSAMDKTGIALLGIQALKEENDRLKNTVEALSKRLEILERAGQVKQ